MLAIETRDVTFRYGSRPAIHQLNMNVHEGDVYGFLGPNGAGKTTTIRMLLGLVRPRTGQIRILDQDLRRERLAVLARVGAHLEEHAFYPYLTGRDNLRLFARYQGPPDEAYLGRLLDTVGLARAADRKVRTYSLGMKQRLGLAQSLLSRPRLLVLDEPLNGLDPTGVIEVRELLTRINREEGITVFLSSHRLDEAERLCNRIGLIRGGSLVQEGRLEDLLSPGETVRYRVRTRDNEAARRRLEQAALVRDVIAVDGALEMAVRPEDVPALARGLVESGLDLEELSPRRASLEDLFRTATMSPAREDES